MQIYKASLELLDYVFYATTEYGKIYETGEFIHNYALVYALHLANSNYTHIKQKASYPDDLQPLNDAGIYITPAFPEHVQFRVTQWNTMKERYHFPPKEPSRGYPDWGFARVMRPEGKFTFFLMVGKDIPESPTLKCLVQSKFCRIRLGKFLGKARIYAVVADLVTTEEGDFVSTPYLNWQDTTLEPQICDILPNALPTRLIWNARFSGQYFKAHFGSNTIYLPAAMSFLRRFQS